MAYRGDDQRTGGEPGRPFMDVQRGWSLLANAIVALSADQVMFARDRAVALDRAISATGIQAAAKKVLASYPTWSAARLEAEGTGRALAWRHAFHLVPTAQCRFNEFVQGKLSDNGI